MFDIRDQHIMVTGGSSGFGRHFAHFLASNGAKVTLAARRADALASVVADINASGDKAQGIVLDVTLADKIDGAMKEAEATFGPIRAVVNNAGVNATKPALQALPPRHTRRHLSGMSRRCQEAQCCSHPSANGSP